MLSSWRRSCARLAFAAATFFAAPARAVTATLAPVPSVELGLAAGSLGLLAGADFLGLALMQLPLGRALDRFGPRRVLPAGVSVAVFGCAAFAEARSLADLRFARLLIGVGVSACLMALLTCFRHHVAPEAQPQANAWMPMPGALGMPASTLPVQWRLTHLAWRRLCQVVVPGMALVRRREASSRRTWRCWWPSSSGTSACWR